MDAVSFASSPLPCAVMTSPSVGRVRKSPYRNLEHVGGILNIYEAVPKRYSSKHNIRRSSADLRKSAYGHNGSRNPDRPGLLNLYFLE